MAAVGEREFEWDNSGRVQLYLLTGLPAPKELFFSIVTMLSKRIPPKKSHQAIRNIYSKTTIHNRKQCKNMKDVACLKMQEMIYAISNYHAFKS